MSEVSKVRENYLHDPFVSHEHYGQMIEDAAAADDAAEFAAEYAASDEANEREHEIHMRENAEVEAVTYDIAAMSQVW